MERVFLLRNYNKTHTQGEFMFEGSGLAYTLEEPSLGNLSFISCINEGTYLVIKGKNSKGKNVFKITGVHKRTDVQIHIANSLRDIEGCVAVGDTYSVKGGNPYVSNSAIAFNKMWDVLPDKFALTIRENDQYKPIRLNL